MKSDAYTADQSYDVSAFMILANNAVDDRKVAERKIKAALKRRNLGRYDQERIDALRAMQDELRAEISLFERSKYFLGTGNSTFAELSHFDHERMVNDLASRYKTVSESDLRGIVGYALYLYYLR